jgi:hypothetical protein
MKTHPLHDHSADYLAGGPGADEPPTARGGQVRMDWEAHERAGRLDWLALGGIVAVGLWVML